MSGVLRLDLANRVIKDALRITATKRPVTNTRGKLTRVAISGRYQSARLYGTLPRLRNRGTFTLI